MKSKRMNETIFRLDGRVVIVTGGAGGICSAICRAYANVGAKVACLDYDGAAAQSLANAIREDGGQAIGLACDVSDERSTIDAAAEVKRALVYPACCSTAPPFSTAAGLSWISVCRNGSECLR